MAIIVEDGTGVADAESYISVEEADTYHANIGNTSWDVIDDKEALLRKATDYMMGKYVGRWAGFRSSLTQALDWPRIHVPVLDSPNNLAVYYNDDLIPTEVKKACAILALKAYTANLLEDQEQRVVSEQVGPISVTYDTSSSPVKKYFEVDNMLRKYFRNSGGVRMVRI